MKNLLISLRFFIVLFTANTLYAQSFQWAVNFGGTSDDRGFDVTMDADGNVITVGMFQGTIDLDPGSGTDNYTSAGSWDGYITKVDANGNYLWGFTFGNQWADFVNTVDVDDAGNIYIGGGFTNTVDIDPSVAVSNIISNTPYGVDAFWAKYNANGNLVMARSWGGSGYDQVNDLVVNETNGEISVVGDFEATVDFNPSATVDNKSSQGGQDIFVSRFDASGNLNSNHTFGTNNTGLFLDGGKSIKVDESTRDYYVTGFFNGSMNINTVGTAVNVSSNGTDGFLIKFSAAALHMWHKVIGYSGTDEINAVTIDDEANAYITGKFKSTVNFDPGVSTKNLTSVPTSNDDAFVAKYSASGDYQWAFRLGGVYAVDEGNTLDCNGDVLFVGGIYQGTNVNMDPNGSAFITSNGLGNNSFVAVYDLNGNYVWSGGIGSSEAYGVKGNTSNQLVLSGSFSGEMDFDVEAATTALLTAAGNRDAYTAKYSLCGMLGSTSTFDTTAVCSYTVPSGDETYYASATVKDTITNAAGCDGILTINLTIDQFSVFSLSQTGPDPVCTGKTTLELSGSENGLNYFLMEGNTQVSAPVAGDGGAIVFTTPDISSATNFKVASAKGENYALYFDGLGTTSNGFVDIVDSTGFGLSANNNFTISIWINPDATQNDFANIYQTNGGGEVRGLWLSQNGSNTNEYVLKYSNGTTPTGDGIVSTLTSDEWQLFTIVKSGNTLTHYVNGVQTASGTTAYATIAPGFQQLMRLGVHNNIRFSGAIDELSIWSKALNSTEVSSLYTAGIQGNEQGLKGYWKFDEGFNNTYSQDEFSTTHTAELKNFTDVNDVWQYGPLQTSGCSGIVSQELMVNVEPVPEEILSQTGANPVCTGGTTINTAGSVDGFRYYLKDENGSIADGPVIGDGGPLVFNPDGISSSTTYHAYAERGDNGGAVSFDGINDYAAINYSFSGTEVIEALTVEAWINTTYIGTSQSQNWAIIDFDQSDYFNLYVDAVSGQLAFGTSVPGGNNIILNSGAGNEVNDGEWHHVAAVYDGTDKILYIDGVQVATEANTHGGVALGGGISGQPRYGVLGDGSESNIFNGQRNSVYYEGSLDEIRLWSIVRTPQEILEHYNKCLKGNETGLELYYPFNETSGDVISDASGHNRNAVLFNTDDDVRIAGITLCTFCSQELTQKITVETDPIPEISLTADPAAIVCSGTTTVTTDNSEAGISYYLQNNTSNAIVDGPVEGTGSSISFTTDVIDEATSYHVIAQKHGQAMAFDGINDYVQIDYQVIPTSGDFTVSVWARHGSTEAVYQEILSQGTIGNAFYIGKAIGGFIRLGDTWTIPSFTFPTDNQWHHYAVVKESGNAHFYFDGNLIASKGSTITNPQGTFFRIGEQYTAAGGEQFEGGIDEIKVWNVALTDTDVLTEMTNCFEPISSGLVAYYTLDEAQGTQIYDASANNYDGSYRNMTPATARITNYDLSCDECYKEMTQNLTIDVNPIEEVTLSATDNSIVCDGSTTITTNSSEQGVAYYLINTNTGELVDGPVPGDGGSLSFTTDKISETTTYAVNAKKTGYALDFDGEDDYAGITLANNLPTGTGSTSIITIEAWVKPKGYLQDEYMGAVAYGPKTCQSSALMAFSSQGRPSFANWCNDFTAHSGPVAKLNEWNHIAVVMNGTESRLYLNGYEYTGTLPLTPTLTNGVLEIGRTDAPNREFNGVIDEVRVWNTARTKQELLDNAFAELTGSEPGLVAYFNMEEGVGGTTVYDLTGNGNNLTLYNMDPNTDWVEGQGACSLQMASTATINVVPIMAQNITIDQSEFCASPASSAINVPVTEDGISYYLKKEGDPAVIDGPYVGDGSGVVLNSGVVSSATTFEVYGAKSIEKYAISFDGVDDELKSATPMTFSNNFTYDFWVKPTATHEIDAETTTGTQGSIGQGRFVVWAYNGYESYPGIPSGSGLGISVGTNGISLYEHKTNHMPAVLVYTGSITEWTHVAVTCENGSTKLYLNGTLIKTGVTTTQAHVYPSNGLGGGAYGHFQGELAEFRLWDYPATQGEITSLMDEHCLKGKEDGLSLYYAFEEGEGTTVKDNGPANYDAMLYNSAANWINTGTDFDCIACEMEMANKVSITFGDGENPVPDVATLPDVIEECEVTISTAPTATDNCSGSIDGVTGDPLTYASQGSYTITWTYTDGSGNMVQQNQNVVIDDVTDPVPDVASLPDIVGECEVTVSTVPTATDNCAGSIEAVTSDPLTYTDQGTYTITWTYDDGHGNSIIQTQTVIVDDVTAPEPDAVSLMDVSGECIATVTDVPTATDNCAGSIVGTTTDPLSYDVQGTYTITWTFDDGNGNISQQTQNIVIEDITAPVPDVASLTDVVDACSVSLTAPTATDACDGPITATTSDPLNYGVVGNYTVTWTYTDAQGNSTDQLQNVQVIDTEAPVPNVASLADVSGNCTVTIANVPTATDACDGAITGTTSDPLTYTSAGVYTVSWVYTDGEGNEATQSQKVIVMGDAAPIPDVATLPDVTGECAVTITTPPTATDDCDGALTGTTTDPLTYTTEGNYTITWTFTDTKNNSVTQMQTVVVQDMTAPLPDVAVLPDVTGTCTATISSFPTATDVCAGTITGETTDPLTYTEEGTHTVTWTYADTKGNEITQTQQVIITGVDKTVSIINGDLFAEATGATFQWLDCNNSMAVIENETDALYDPQETGTYAVEITQNGCVAISDCYLVDPLAVGDVKAVHVTVKPMPAIYELTVTSDVVIESIKLYDLKGTAQPVRIQAIGMKEYTLHIADLSAGMYVLSIQTRDGVVISKVVKE